MPLSYPLTPPDPFKLSSMQLAGESAISRNVSPFDYSIQQYNWPGQRITADVQMAPMKRADAEEVVGFLLGATRGTFYFRDYSNDSPRGTIAGSASTSTTAIANAVTVSITGHTGQFAVGDWFQLGQTLYKVIKVDSTTDYVVFPAMRKAYASGTSITYTEPKGVFRLANPQRVDWAIDRAVMYGISFGIVEEIEAE